MVIQSRNLPTLRSTAAYVSTDDESDDDPWSGYGDTLEMELNTATPAASSPPEAQATACAEPDEFAAACARLQQRGDALQQRQLLHAARRPQPLQRYFPHLEQGHGYGLGPRGYAPAQPYTPAPRAVQYAPPAAAHQMPAPVPAVLNIEPDPLTAPPALALPYEIDAWGNPILPEGMDLDAWGNLVPRIDYNS